MPCAHCVAHITSTTYDKALAETFLSYMSPANHDCVLHTDVEQIRRAIDCVEEYESFSSSDLYYLTDALIELSPELVNRTIELREIRDAFRPWEIDDRDI